MRTNSSYSGSEDEMRTQMSWAEQVDIAYPLDECEFRGQIEERRDVVERKFCSCIAVSDIW